MPNWKKIKAEYIRGGTSYSKLAEKYGVSLSTLTKHGMREKWADLKNDTRKKAEAKMSESVANQEAKREDSFQSLADKLLQHISNNIDVLASSATAVRDITAALKNLRDIKGLKSELDMQEQIARIEKLRRDAQQEEDDKDKKVVVTIAGGDDSWQK